MDIIDSSSSQCILCTWNIGLQGFDIFKHQLIVLLSKCSFRLDVSKLVHRVFWIRSRQRNNCLPFRLNQLLIKPLDIALLEVFYLRGVLLLQTFFQLFCLRSVPLLYLIQFLLLFLILNLKCFMWRFQILQHFQTLLEFRSHRLPLFIKLILPLFQFSYFLFILPLFLFMLLLGINLVLRFSSQLFDQLTDFGLVFWAQIFESCVARFCSLFGFFFWCGIHLSASFALFTAFGLLVYVLQIYSRGFVHFRQNCFCVWLGSWSWFWLFVLERWYHMTWNWFWRLWFWFFNWTWAISHFHQLVFQIIVQIIIHFWIIGINTIRYSFSLLFLDKGMLFGLEWV